MKVILNKKVILLSSFLSFVCVESGFALQYRSVSPVSVQEFDLYPTAICYTSVSSSNLDIDGFYCSAIVVGGNKSDFYIYRTPVNPVDTLSAIINAPSPTYGYRYDGKQQGPTITYGKDGYVGRVETGEYKKYHFTSNQSQVSAGTEVNYSVVSGTK